MSIFTIALEIEMDFDLEYAEPGRLLCVSIEEAVTDRLASDGHDARVIALSPRLGTVRNMVIDRERPA